MSNPPMSETCSRCRKQRFPMRHLTEVIGDALAHGEFRCAFTACRARLPYTPESLEALRAAAASNDLDEIVRAVRDLKAATP